MFNQLTASAVVAAIGATARSVARDEDGELSEFDRAQLMSAYSATRHLEAELESYPGEFARFRGRLAERLAEAEGDAAPLVAAREAVDGDGDPSTVGDALCDLLAHCRDDGSEGALALRADLHVLLRELADREVDLLAEALA